MLTPNARYLLIFYIVTLPLAFWFCILLSGLIISFLKGFDDEIMCRWFNEKTEELIEWRNSLPIVKNAYNRAHLFEHIKSFE